MTIDDLKNSRQAIVDARDSMNIAAKKIIEDYDAKIKAWEYQHYSKEEKTND